MGQLERWIRAYTDFAIRRRGLMFLLTAVVVAGGGYAMATRLVFNTTFRIWHPPGSENLLNYDQLIERFGSDDSVLILFRDPNGVMHNDALAVARRLTDALWKVPSVKRVDSVANFSVTRASRIEHESPALAVTDGLIIAPGDQNDIIIWSRKDWSSKVLSGHEGLVEHLLVGPDGRLYSGSIDRSVRVWDPNSGQLLYTLRGAPAGVSAMLLSADGNTLYVGSYKSILAFDTTSGRRLGRWDGALDYVTRLALSPDGQTLYVADKRLTLRDPKTLEVKATWEGHRGFINGLVLAPDGTPITAGEDGRILAWNSAGEPRLILAVPDQNLLSLAIDGPGERLMVGVADGSIRTVSVAGGTPIVTRLHDRAVVDLAVTADGRVYSGSRDRNIGMHLPGEGPRMLTLEAHRGAVRRVVVAGQTLVSSGDAGDIYVWDLADHTILARLRRVVESAPEAALTAGGAPVGSLKVINGFRYPVEIRVGGQSRGVVRGGRALELTGLPVLPAKECADDSGCGAGQYCDYEAETPTCAGRTLVEAYVPGSAVRVWVGASVLLANATPTVQVPGDEPFSVAEPAQTPADPRTQIGQLISAYPEARPLLEPALQKILGEDAKDPETFLSPALAGALASELSGAPETLTQFLTTHAQSKLNPLQLPVQPFRLRELSEVLLRGPRSPAVGLVVNDKLDTAVVAASIRIDVANDPLSQSFAVRRAIEAAVEAEKANSNYTFHLAGDCIQDTTFLEYAERDVRRLFPFFIGAIALVLLILYGRPSGVLLPLGITLLAIIVTMGISAMLGAELNNMTVAVPQVVLASCIGDAVHIFNSYADRLRQGDNARDATFNAIVPNFIPCFWTTATTFIGFISMLTCTIVPIGTFGWMAALGTLTAFLVSFMVMPGILSILPVSARHKEHRPNFLDRLGNLLDRALLRLAHYVNATGGTILFMTAVATAVATYGLTKLSFDTNSLAFFAPESPFRQATRFTEENVTGPFSVSLMVDTGEQGGVRKVENLAELSRLTDHLLTTEGVTHVTSLADILMSMNRVMGADADEDYAVPADDARASGYYNAYTFSLRAGMELSNMVSADESTTIVSVRLEGRPSGWIIRWGDNLKEWVAKNLPDVKMVVTAKAWMFSHMLSEMARNFFENVGQAVILISLVMLILARSWRLGGVAVVANLLPLYLTVGFISLFGITLDISVIVASCVALGIVVDDTIHFIARYRNFRLAGHNHQDTVVEVLREDGRAAFSTTVVLVTGFAMFMFTDYMINRNLGMIVAIMLTFGLLFDLLVHPAILSFVARKPFKGATSSHH